MKRLIIRPSVFDVHFDVHAPAVLTAARRPFIFKRVMAIIIRPSPHFSAALRLHRTPLKINIIQPLSPILSVAGTPKLWVYCFAIIDINCPTATGARTYPSHRILRDVARGRSSMSLMCVVSMVLLCGCQLYLILNEHIHMLK